MATNINKIFSGLMMGTEMVPEMSVMFNQLTWLVAQEDFINGKLELTSSQQSCSMEF
jgi:hypothetical protein